VSEISRATVIGGRGFIGSHLVAELERTGVRTWVPQPDDTHLIERELCAVYYCAGVNAASARPQFDAQRAHIAQVADVLERGRFDSFLYLSSTRVYLGADRGDEEAALQVKPLLPDQLFNITKLAGEAVCLGYNRPAIRVARVSNVFGPGARAVNFLPSIIAAARSTRRVVLRSALDSAKDYLSIRDCVAMLLAIAQRGTERLYNAASGVNVTHAQITAELARLTGAAIEVAPDSPTIAFPIIEVGRIRCLVPAPTETVLDSFADLVHTQKETA